MSGKIRLDARLSAVKDMVQPSRLVADIGCDHGYLICELVKSGIAKCGLACDANIGPLNRAYKTITENCLSDKIDTVLTKGLNDLPFSRIDTFVIAGMGGMLIAEILLTFPQAKDERFNFVLQPMTKHEKLREAIFKNGFAITSEKAVVCDKRLYTVINVRYTQPTYFWDETTFYTGLLNVNNDFSARLYLEHTAQRLENKASGLKMSKDGKIVDNFEKYTRIARKIRERLDYDL